MSNELYHFDPTIPKRIERFFAEFLVHTKGEHSGKPFVLLPWQRDIISDVYGTLKADGTRRYRNVYIEVPRKQGKSHLLAGLCLYELLFGDEGGEIYACANSREQARILFNIATDIVACSKRIRGLVTVYKNGLFNAKKRSIFKVLSRDANTALGVNASFVVMDELLGAPDDALYNSMVTSLGARRQPLMFSITTAGWSRVSFCYQLHEYTEKVISGVLEDAAFYGRIYGIREGEDWTSPEIWAKCNPSLNYTVPLEFLQSEYNRAKEFPQFENPFKTLYLNAWLSSEKSWITDEQWTACEDRSLTIDDFLGEPCYAGLDLSSTQDLTALVLCFHREGKFYLFPYAFCPEDGIKYRSRKDKVPYEIWADAEFLTATPGNATDYDYIISKLGEIKEKFNLAEVTVDRWNSSFLVTKLQEQGFIVTLFGQGFSSMTSPVRAMERLVLQKNIVHSGHPVMRWCMSNVLLKVDPAGNSKPDKGKSREKIDIIVASLMALERCSANNLDPANTTISWVA